MTPQLNNPGPPLTTPRPGNPLQQKTIGTGPQIAPGLSVDYLDRYHRRHVTKYRHVRKRKGSAKQSSEGISPNQVAGGRNQPRESNVSQPVEKTDTEKTLKDLDAALAKRLKNICRGC